MIGPFQFKKILNDYPKIKRLTRRIRSYVSSNGLSNRFLEWYSFFEESETWDSDQLCEYQLGCIRKLCLELAATSDFYRERLGSLDVKRISSLDEFRLRVPTLSKIEFRESYSKILCSSWKSRMLVKTETSGTTGLPLQFYHPVSDQAREWAAICHQWKRVGFFPGHSRRAVFAGLTETGKLVDTYPRQKMMRCSILNFKKHNVIHFADEIRKSKIEFYHGYPSAIYLLALEITRSGIVFPQPKAVLLASEIVYDWQLAGIQEAFPKARIFAHYGCAERTVLAGWCEKRREYHVLPQYGLLELDDNTSEIIGTNLYNTVNGFVRYRMTDTVLKIEHSECPDCHRPYTPRLIEISGRTEDFLYSPDKGWIPPAIVTYPLKSLKVIREVQFIQKEKSKIKIRYATSFDNRYPLKNDLEHIEAGLINLFGAGMKLDFEQVDDFERGATGKFKWIICELDELKGLAKTGGS